MKKILTVAALLLSTSSIIFAGDTDTHEVKITAKVASATTVKIVDNDALLAGDVSLDKSKNSMHFDFTGNGETKTESLNFVVTSNKGYDLKLTSSGKLASAKESAEMAFTMKINDKEVQGDGGVVHTETLPTNATTTPLKLEVTIDSKGAAAADDYEGTVVMNITSK